MEDNKSNSRLPSAFFNRPTLTVAKELLGKQIVRRTENGLVLRGVIGETEAYIGPDDRASHTYLPRNRRPSVYSKKIGSVLADAGFKAPKATFDFWKSFGGKITPRTVAAHMDGGTIYIYLVYGMHYQLNFSTAGFGRPECVLIRCIVPKQGEKGLANGPGKLCKYLKLESSFYGESVVTSPRIWVEDVGITIPNSQVSVGRRVGIGYAGAKWSQRKWRLWVNLP